MRERGVGMRKGNQAVERRLIVLLGRGAASRLELGGGRLTPTLTHGARQGAPAGAWGFVVLIPGRCPGWYVVPLWGGLLASRLRVGSSRVNHKRP